MEERIVTLHPEGKEGVNISKAKYEIIKEAILGVLRTNEEMTFTGLFEAVTSNLQGKFEGSVGWYYTTVKLDLEARGLIKRVPDSKPQRLCIA